MKTNLELVYHCHHAIGECYMWGSFGQRVTEKFILQKAAQYPAHYTESYIKKCRQNIGKLAYDCVGLIKSFYWGGPSGYTAGTDLNTETMFLLAREKGLIKDLPEKPGLILYRKGHVGVYIGRGELIEAKGVDYGVVGSKVEGRGFTHWFQCPYISGADPLENPVTEPVNNETEVTAVELNNWQWDMLFATLTSLRERGIIDSEEWHKKAADHELTKDELAWLSLVVAGRIAE